ncbi:MAG: hypothetical protein M3391_09005 [Actinomycetota bacterium]|nr:hypothetical protein [Actinomycetota bacterium]
MLGELTQNDQYVIADLEAGIGTLLRMNAGQADVVLVIAEPSAKSIEVGRRAANIATDKARVIVVANRIRSDEEFDEVRVAFEGHEIWRVPEDPGIAEADRRGEAPIDVASGGPGVAALLDLGKHLTK